MGVERRLGVAERFVVDAVGAGNLEERVADPGGVEEVLGARGLAQVVEARHHGVGEEEAVAGKRLHVSDHEPAALQAGDHVGVIAGAGESNAVMDEGGHGAMLRSRARALSRVRQLPRKNARAATGREFPFFPREWIPRRRLSSLFWRETRRDPFGWE